MAASLREGFDALLLDLDGTLYRGAEVITGAPAALNGSGQTLVYVTNNASRAASTVAGHLRELGFRATVDEVVTSAQAAAHVLAARLPAGATVLIVGSDDLAAEVGNAGLRPVRRFDGVVPDAVVQGHSPATGWPDLAEASYAVRAGALWVAANTDATLPNERGLAPGNGAMVAALRAATDSNPVVAGKPYAPLLEDALVRAGSRNALVVGDRLDTDIDGARCVELPSLMVLTGVSTIDDVRARPADRRPTYIARDLDALNRPVVDREKTGDDPIARLDELLDANPGQAVALTD
ncbi:NagD-like protein [Nocardia nova SH22a]|uniref:NagD-like protein n=1 Tax=Nocardia nova SH22a TaxID=1415166 RepID=W5TDJ1_9NOCA|nr:HAD hydrolase-like protein [Nocardia nova]AHH17380.1 NagD-like protein [Nocardia nova SH22a]